MTDEKTAEVRAKLRETGIRCKRCGERMSVWRTCQEKDTVQRIRRCDTCIIYRVTWEK